MRKNSDFFVFLNPKLTATKLTGLTKCRDSDISTIFKEPNKKLKLKYGKHHSPFKIFYLKYIINAS